MDFGNTFNYLFTNNYLENYMKKQKPIICKSQLTNEYYYVTKYIDNGKGNIESLNKRKATKEEIDEYNFQLKGGVN